MNIRQTVHIPRRVLSLALCAAMVLTLLPLPARAEGICAHHPEHTADCGYKAAVEGQDCSHSHDDSCGYQEASPCTHSHDASCGYREASNCTHQHTEECGENGESCTHSHDGSCGYQEAENCTHSHDDACGYREARSCTHVHNDTCGYAAAVAGSPCTYQCEICAQQQNAQNLCTHGNAPDACEACASDARVASVQKLIDALPETVTEENREAAQSALSAVEAAKSALTEAEQAKLTLTRYTALKALLAEPETPDTGKVITAWEWIEDEELAIIDPETGLAHLPFTSPERIAYFEDVAGLLPVAILADGEELTLGDWLCPDYPMESGAYEGEYVFKTTLPEGYTLPDGTNVLRLAVVLGDPEGEPVAMMGITPEKPEEEYWEDGFHFYKLYNEKHLYWFANEVNNPSQSNSNYLSAVLMDDIIVNRNVLDTNGNLNSGSFESWTPIGTNYKNKSYCGKFDGQGHTISGLYFNDSTKGHIGLFGDVNSCNITRLGVVDSYFGGNDAVGGLCGSATGNANIRYCYTTATVTGNSNVGTFCGYAADGARIYYCYSAGRVGSDYGAFLGTTARMSNCYALSNTNYIGSNDKVNYKTMAAFKSGEVTYGMTKTDATPGWRQTIGTHDFPQCTTEGDVVYCATVDGTVNYHNHTGDTCTMCEVPTFENGHYTILTKEQLYWFADYVRKGHPDASAWVNKDITVDEDWVPIGSDGSYTGEFQGTRKYITISGIPAGSSLLGPVNQDVTIRNFKIAGGGSLCTDNFGRIESCFAIGGPVVRGTNQGTIKDSGVSNGKLIAGDNSGSIEACTASNNSVLVAGKNISDAVSGCTASNNSVLIAGDNSGKLTDCTASDASKLIGGNNSGDITNCKVTSSQSSYASESMLIAKDNSGNLTNCTVSTGDALIAGNNNGGTITNCEVTFGNKLIGGANSGTITGCSVSDSIDVKLVAGANSGTIQKSYAAGSTSASLCESNNSKIINCYATATSGSAKLCGSNSGTIANCFAAGESGTVLCGGSTSGVTNCYYRAGTSANTVGGTTLTTDAPFASGEVAYRLNQGTDTYPGGVWGQNIGASDNPCPVLYEKTVYYHVDANPQYHNHNKYCNICTPMPDYVNNVWQIKNVDDLYWFAQYVIGNITPGDTYTYDAVLVNDITVNHNVLNPDGTLSADTDKFMVWTPIGDTYKGFTGTFNGNHKTISGLYVNTSDKSYIGLFGVLESGATVKDLTIRDSYFGGTSYVGSICGKSSGNVENCTNSGTVSGGSFVGGVFGSCSGGSVSNCYNTGSITSTSYFVGGVGGYNEATVTACYNTGMVSSSNNNQVGGVIGRNVGDVTACYNTGAISGNNYVGGVCGYVSGGTVNACYSTGTVSGSSDVGGVCGTSSRDSNQTPKISNCYYNNELYSGNGFGSSYNSTVENVSGKTTKEFASGEVAYLLNGSTDNGTWKQNIDKAGASRDETPNFTGAAVYQATSGECTPGYTNNTSLEKNHVFEDHICVFCDKRDQDPITVTGIKANDKTYDGSVEAQLNTTNMKLSNVQDGHTVTVSAAGVFDNATAGTGKTVTITLTLDGADSGKYYLEKETITTQADITKKPVTAVVTVTPKTYDGTNTATVNAEVKEGLVSGDSITITGLTGTFDTATAGTGKTVTVNAAGKSITGTGATNYAVTIPDTAPGTITKAQATITVAEGKDAYSKTYGDPAFQLEGITDNSSDADVTYAVTEGTGVVSVSDSGQVTILKAGTATITLSLPESDNYLEATSQTIRIDVAKKVGTVNITGDPSKIYDGQPAALTEEMFSVTEDGGRIPSVAYKEKTAEDSAYTGTAPTNAGDYILRVTLAETDNYAEVMETKEFTIRPKPVTVSGITADGKTYDGNTTATLKYDEVKFDGILDGDILTVTGTGTFADANAGESKTVTITNLTLGGASKDNYVLAADGQQATATAAITKANASVTKAPEDAKSLYSGVDVPLVTAGTAQGGTMMYRLGENGPWTETIPQAAAHGEYTVYYYVKGDGNHEDTAQQSLKARILPFEITAQPQAKSMDYGESTALSVTLNPKAADVSGITYQWCLVTVEDSKEIYTPLEGETRSELTLTKPNAGEYTYVCIVTCGDYSETSSKATVTVTAVSQGLPTTDLPDGLWVEGGEEPLTGSTIDLKTPSSFLMTSYTYNGASADAHQNYPTGMQIYSVQKDDQGNTAVAPVAELGNLLRYSGCSIRINGKPGIRMITSLTKEAKELLKKGELAGYTLEEYGTVAVWSSDLDNQPLTLNTKKSRSNYAYKRGVSDPVFANVGALTQYTNVLVWDSLEAKKYDEDIVMRPYIKLSNQAGETVTLYGGTVSRSIGYVAQQNANTFSKGTAGYKYVHEIIDKVNALHSSTGTNTTTGGNG